MTTYQRVIPRDLFNEAKLLKCLGRLALIIHDYGDSCPIHFEHETDMPYDGFIIDQCQDSGGLACVNLILTNRHGDEICLESSYNSKDNYPLWFLDEKTGEYGRVFDEDGELTPEFKGYAGL